jgi:hypothetical protein
MHLPSHMSASISGTAFATRPDTPLATRVIPPFPARRDDGFARATQIPDR